MDLNYLRKVIKIFDEGTASELLIEEEGLKLKLSKNKDAAKNMNPVYTMTNFAPAHQPGENSAMQNPVHQTTKTENFAKHIEVVTSTEEVNEKLHTIHSPIVGTYYKAPSPDSAAFVEIGSKVKPGTVLCIVEAMKLMNEIESDVSGTIVKILGADAKPVEYNQPLFVVELD